MSKKSKAKIEESPSPQSPLREEEEPARPNGPAAPQSWGWLRPSDLPEPSGAAKWDEAQYDQAVWP